MSTDDAKSPDAPVRIEAKAVMTLAPVVAEATADVRRNFALMHVRAAEHFAHLLVQHEREHEGAGWGGHYDVAQHYATGAIILSFSAVEAAVDEAEDDIELPDDVSLEFERMPTLDHVQAVLRHKGVSEFDRGARPYQPIHVLNRIRNGLVHPKAEWDSKRERNRVLSKLIVSNRLPLSPFQGDPDLAFPHGCMSAGVAIWAATSARAFICAFRERLSLPTKKWAAVDRVAGGS